MLSDVWLDAFAREVTNTLIARCRRHASWCLHYYRARRGPQHHCELVQDALGDIFEGRVAWNPTRETLLDKVFDVIRYRVRDEMRSAAERRQSLSLDRTLHEGGRERRIDVEIEVALAVGFVDDPESELERKQMRALGARVGDALAVLAGGDGEVLALLSSIREDDSERREDVLAQTGMTREGYHNARRRLRRLARQLPGELLELASALVDEGDDPT